MSEQGDGTTDTSEVSEQSALNPLAMSLEQLNALSEDDLDQAGLVVEDEAEVVEEEAPEVENQEATSEDQSVDPEVDTEEQKEQEQDEPNYKQQVESLFEPFKADGVEVKLDSIEEAKQLMRKGINYTKKMQALAPQIPLMKMLQNNDLLDADKISYLIDLDKKNPEAIAKLIKDAGINPLDIDSEKEVNYKPANHKVSTQEVELDSHIADVVATPTGAQTLQILSGMDDKSKELIQGSPLIVSEVNTHISNGMYQQIMSEVTKRRLLGTIGNVPDIQAYYTVGQELQNKGVLTTNSTSPVTEQPQPTPEVDKTQVRRQRAKVAASPPKKGGANKRTQKQDFNPLSMTSEELAKYIPDWD